MKQLIVDYIPFEVAPEAINEAMSSNGKLIVKGVLQRAEAKNQNGRVYPMELLQREAKKYTGNFIKEKRALGELDHPDSSVVNLNNVSHNVLEMHWDGNDLLTNRKIIDVITIGSNGNVKFGYPVLKTEQNRTAKRLIFEYGDEVVMSLKWEPEYNAIVFDYLVPLSDQFHGVWAYYGPSLNRFDALIYNKGKWTYKKDLDIKLHKTIKDKFYKSPK